MLATACGVTYWAANYNNRNPTELDGVWDVASVDPPSAADRSPAVVFFEYNRAGMVVFKSKAGKYQTHQFEVDSNQHILRMWQRWLTQDRQLFEGSFAHAGSQLDVTGRLENLGELTLHLIRRPNR